MNQMPNRAYRWMTLTGVLLILTAIIVPNLIDRSLWGRVPVLFHDPRGDRLQGSYYPGKMDAGILLLPGFGSDQATMRSIASEFTRDGYHVFTFDFSGHGRSSGTLGYDNAESPFLANQTLLAIEEFEQISGLQKSEIIVAGHSLGARVGLQAATMEKGLAGLILMGTQVNLGRNVQAEFFTGVADASLEWVKSLARDNPATNILLVSGEWDDILTPESAKMLAEKLNGRPLEVNTGAGEFSNGTRRDVVVFPMLVHNYEVYSPRVLSLAKSWTAKVFGVQQPSGGASLAAIRIACWVVGYAGMVTGLVGAAGWMKPGSFDEGASMARVEITDPVKFLRAKLWLWTAALPFAALLGSVFFILPMGVPTFNLVYVALIGGYGILMVVLYRLGKIPGTKGCIPFEQDDGLMIGWHNVVGITAVLLVLTAAYARTGWFFVFPLNLRFVWLVIFSLPTALGFWIGMREMQMIERATHGKGRSQGIAALIGIMPFFFYTILLAVIGSVSGLIGGLQGLFILGLVVISGGLLRRVSRMHWLVAFCQAVMLYWLILPQGVLFK